MSDEQMRRGPDPRGSESGVGLDTLTEEILPALITRLRASRLGELEVRSGSWRVRLRRDGRTARQSIAASPSDAGLADVPEDQVSAVARSPAVGYFNPAPELAVGHSVQTGDSLGSVDVLGIVQDVSAPIGGIVSEILAESGQAVEYGQALAAIDPLVAASGDEPGTGDDGSAAAAD